MNFFNKIINKSNEAAEKINSVAKTLLSDKVMMVSLDKLHFDKDFKAVFNQEEDKVERIAQNMKANGFDKSQPIIIDENYAILDGNSRYLASQKAGIKKVPVIIKLFESKKEALLYEINLQMNRRNIKDDSVLIETYNTIASMKDENGKKLFTDVEIAQKLGVSPRQISKVKEVDIKASEEVKEALSKGDISLNQAYGIIHKAEEPAQEDKSPEPEESAPKEKPSVKAKKSSDEKKEFEKLNLKFKVEDFAKIQNAASEAKLSVSEYVMKIVMSNVHLSSETETVSQKETA
ncbi:MAG: ParB/RepB/Spo0J family partition protein [Treponema sp.]|nr:ParB/RepB/Spo0J family partition protein [Treponema sp.]